MDCLNDFLTKHYQDLTRYASAFTDCPTDLVHHTYIKMIDAGFTFIDEVKTQAYFRRAIKNNGRHDFRKLYEIKGEELVNITEEHDIDKRICIERVDSVVRMLDQFDRQIFELYLRGENMQKLAKESGIPSSTIYHTLSKVRQLIKDNA